MKYCKSCDTEFATPSSLKRHILAKHEKREAKNQCPHADCHEVFARQETVRRHIRSKHDRDLSICSVCLKQFRADYILQHRAMCGVKYWKKVQQRYANLDSRTGAACPTNSTDHFPLERSTSSEVDTAVGDLPDLRNENYTLRIVHEHMFDARASAIALHYALLHFEELSNVRLYKKALVTAFRLGLTIHNSSKRPHRPCASFDRLTDVAVAIDQLHRDKTHINTGDVDGNTLLLKVCTAGVAGLLEPLSRKGADFDNRNNHDESAFELAVRSNDIDTVRHILALVSRESISTLYRFVHNPNAARGQDIISFFVGQGSNIDNTSPEDLAHLDYIEFRRNLECVHFIHKLGPNQHIDYTLHKVTRSCYQNCYESDGCFHPELACLLIEYGADPSTTLYGCRPDWAVHCQGPTLLHFAARKVSVRLLHAALARKSMPETLDITDHLGYTALHYAAWKSKQVSQERCLAVVKMLVDAGAEVNAKNFSVSYPLMLAAGGGCKALVQLLLDAGADIDTTDSTGNSALMCAVSEEKLEAAEFLLNAGANVSLRNIDNLSALDLAASNGNSRLVTLLLGAGAYVGHPHRGGYSALFIAARRGHETIVSQLLRMAPSLLNDEVRLTRAFEEAMNHQHQQVVATLLSSNLVVFAGNLLSYAVQWSSAAIVQLLRDKGARLHHIGLNMRTDLFAARDMVCGTHERFFEAAAKCELLENAPDLPFLPLE